MGKREAVKKPKSPRDFYATIDPDAVAPLLPFIKGKTYAEPCAGKGDLVDLIGDNAECVWASDIHNNTDSLDSYDASDMWLDVFYEADLIITNPPFSKSLLLPIIDHLVQSGKPVWLLLPADIIHNLYMAPYMQNCNRIVSVGRLCWFLDETTGKKVKGVDNYVWLEMVSYKTLTTFHSR